MLKPRGRAVTNMNHFHVSLSCILVIICFTLPVALSVSIPESFVSQIDETTSPYDAISSKSHIISDDWLDGWTHRKSHVINSSLGAGVDYQIEVNVHFGSGTDSGQNVFCDSKCQPDFDDIRFTDDEEEKIATTILLV